MHHLARDLRLGLRMLAKRPGTSLLAVMAIAWGIGLTTTMFSIIDGALLRGLPYAGADRLVTISRERGGTSFEGVAPDDFADWSASQHAFEDLAGASGFAAAVSVAGEPAEQYRGARITPNTLALLRVRPAAGRDFVEADARSDAPPVAIISDTLWRARFERATDVVGRTLRVNGVVVAIAGVMPPGFGFPAAGDLWVAERLERQARRGDGRLLEVIGRLKPGVTIAAARTDMKSIASHLAELHPENRDVTAVVRSLTRRRLGPEAATTLSATFGAVFGVLLVACANVVNLQLARAIERMPEIGVRFALGATPWRVVRQFLAEGAILSVAGGLSGLGLAWIGIGIFNRAIDGSELSFPLDVRLDVRVLVFVAALTVFAALASSLIPALRVSHQDLNEVLRDRGRASTGFRVGSLSRGLVLLEVAVSFALLSVSGLMIKSLVVANRVTYAFATNLVVATIVVPEREYHSTGQIRQLVDRIVDRMGAVPGVSEVAAASSLPDEGAMDLLYIEGELSAAHAAVRPGVRRVEVSRGFFDVIRLPVRQGRAIADQDRAPGARGAVVTDSFVRKFFPAGDALGHRIAIGDDVSGAPGGGRSPLVWRTIVGVVPAVVVAQAAGDATESVFVPLAEPETRRVMFYASAAGGLSAVGPALRRAILDVDSNLPAPGVSTLDRLYDRRTLRFKVFSGVFSTFGFVTLLLAAAGLYGVTSFAVRRRTAEIGVRMALGADRARITRMVVRQGVGQIGIGMAAGAGLGGLLASSLPPILFRVKAWDPAVWSAAIAVLAAAGLVASYVPARRAASVDPLDALRHD